MQNNDIPRDGGGGEKGGREVYVYITLKSHLKCSDAQIDDSTVGLVNEGTD